MGEWRTLRRPKPPVEVSQALGTLTGVVASAARRGDWHLAQTGKAALDVLQDHIYYEPKEDTDG